MGTRKAKRSKGDGPRYTPQNQHVWIAYSDPDAPDNPPLRVKVRAALTFHEANTLVWKEGTPVPEVWDLMAPHVVDWNYDGPDGEPLDPPAEAGGMQFDYVPNGIFWKMVFELKARSSGIVQSKRLAPDGLTPWKRTEEPDGAMTTSTNDSDTTES